MARPPLDMSYLDVAPGRWKWVVWPLFVLAGLAYLAVGGFVFHLSAGRFGPAGAAIVYVLFLAFGGAVFRAGMAARRRKPRA